MSFTVYKSSAGSGKTYTLVREYLKLVLPDPVKFNRILAITFTNKAAAEMKDRILKSLMEFALGDTSSDPDLTQKKLKEISNETGLARDLVIKNAGHVLRNILHDYSDFAVSTIDSFVHRVVRSFAFDLRIPLNFEVEMDAKSLIAKMVDILISRAGTDDKLTQTLVNFIRTKTLDEKSWNIERDLGKVAEHLMNEDALPFITRLKDLTIADFEEINLQLNRLIYSFEEKITGLAAQAMKLINSKGLSHSSFYYGTTGISRFFENILLGSFSGLHPNTRVMATVYEGKWYGGKASAAEIAAIDEIRGELEALFHEIEKVTAELNGDYVTAREIRTHIYPLAVLGEIEKILADYKTENDLILISEFNSRISAIVHNEPVPFIYERLGEKYHHFLIDEFQDTSVMQWQNLIPLFENALATENFTMVVGDGKQAIYRFRSGEVEQFTSLPQIHSRPEGSIHKQREEILERNYREKVLDHNYRSQPKIIEFNNDFFTRIAERLPERFAGIYRDVVQLPVKSGDSGYVCLSFPVAGDEAMSFEEFNFNGILDAIGEAKQDGFSYNDIAILSRNNNHAAAIAAELLNKEIPVISSESLLLCNSSDVRFLISVIGFLVNPDNKIAQASIIGWLWRTGRITGELDKLFRDFGISPASGIDTAGDGKIVSGANGLNTEPTQVSSSKFTGMLSTFGFNLYLSSLPNLSVYDLVEELIRIFHLNKPVNPYLCFFLDAILSASRDQKMDISGFQTWWDEQKDKLSIVVPAGTDAIQVMTIHKAKGLEFPVVIYPFAAEKLRKTKDKLWVDYDHPQVPLLKTALVNTGEALLETDYASLFREEMDKSLLDMINLLYVVMTRPTERLYIFSQRPPQSSDAVESVPGFLRFYLESAGSWDETKSQYTFGKRSGKLSKPKKPVRSFTLSEVISENWRKRILLSSQAPKNLDFTFTDDKRSYGRLVHLILSQIKTAEDVSAVINHLVADGLTNEMDKVALEEEIRRTLAHPSVEPYFRKNLSVKTEAEILDAEGRISRPDRVIVEDRNATVIDFKTGKREDRHSEQVRHYMNLLSQIGYDRVKGLLIYIGEKDPETVEVAM